MKWGLVVSNTLFETVLMDKSVGINILGTGRCKFPSGAFSIHCCNIQRSVVILVNTDLSNSKMAYLHQIKSISIYRYRLRTSIVELVIFSTEYAVPYQGSVESVLPSNFVETQMILLERLFCERYYQKI